jgi:hypothetical protein
MILSKIPDISDNAESKGHIFQHLKIYIEMFFCACTDEVRLQQAKTKTILGLISLGPHADCFKLHSQQECNKCAILETLWKHLEKVT